MPIAKLKCTNCKDRYPREQMKKHPAGNFCTTECVIEYATNKSRKTKITKEKKDHALRKKVFYASDTRKQHELTQPVFNKLRRLQEFKWFADRDLEPECISCGKKNMDWCCGHFKTVASQGALRYDERNTYLQCNKYCNSSLSGNINGNKNTRGFLQGLAERFGSKKAKRIIEYCEADRMKRWTGAELMTLRTSLNKNIKKIQLN